MKQKYIARPGRAVTASTRRAKKRVASGCHGSKRSKRRVTASVNWEDMQYLVGEDLYEYESDAAVAASEIASEVEAEVGIWAEPSVQAGHGGVWFHSTDDDHIIISNYDYETWNDEIAELARDSSNEADFRQRLKGYYLGLIENYGTFEDEDWDEDWDEDEDW